MLGMSVPGMKDPRDPTATLEDIEEWYEMNDLDHAREGCTILLVLIVVFAAIGFFLWLAA